MSPLRISVIGTGAVARALLNAHTDAGGRVLFVGSRDVDRAEELASRHGARGTTALAEVAAADVVIVAVSDRAVAEVGARLSSLRPTPSCVFLHTSGALSASDLAGVPLLAGSLHPLQSFPRPAAGSDDRQLGARVAGTHWFHEGAGEAEARALVELWSGQFHVLSPGSKALYHAGAAVLSNHTVALFAAATRLFELAGIPADEARAPLATLLAGTSANLGALGSPEALTGPIARGDDATVMRHLHELRAHAPDLMASYVALALVAVDVALDKGSLDSEGAARLRALLTL
jgi:predicted short-subunit dehydrogenase-like oxidoreductase (DUF2520 family)